MANINSFDDNGVKRIVRAVRNVERSPLNSPTYRRKSRSRASTGPSGDTSVFPCIVTTVSSTSIFAVKLSDPTGTPFLVVPLSYQDTNLSAGNVIMATEYTAVTL